MRFNRSALFSALLASLLQISLSTMAIAAAESENPSLDELGGEGPGPVPITNQFQVNTVSAQNQDGARVGMAEDGSFVVVWESDDFDGKYQAVVARRFTSAGSPIGNESWVTWDFPLDGHEVAVDKNGGFVVLWHASALEEASLRFKRYDSAGNQLGAEVDVATELPSTNMDIDMDANGGFVVVWTAETEELFADKPIAFGSERKGSVDGFSLFGRRFSVNGAGIGSKFEVAHSLLYDAKPEVALSDSGFLVVWEAGLSGETKSIQGRAFDSMNMPLTRQYQVSTMLSSFGPTVSATEAGEFVVVWDRRQYYSYPRQTLSNSETLKGRTADLGETESVEARGQRIDASGNPIGGEFLIAESSPDFLYHPIVKAESNGSFVVMWWRDDSVQALRVDSLGMPVGDLQLITSTGPEGSQPLQARPDLAINPAGRLVAVWDSYSSAGEDTSFLSVQGRMFFLPCEDGTSTCRSFFFDGFESNDTSAWSLSTP